MAIDWLMLKNEYATTKISLRKLAEKHSVSFSAVEKRARKEAWASERTATCDKIETKVRQKTVAAVASHKADRIVRLLSIGDRLAEKLERAANDLGEYYTVKRKTSHVEKDDDDKPVAVEETAEIAVQGTSAINGANLRQLAATLKDLRDVAQTGRTDEDELGKIAELMARLDKEADNA